MPPAKTAAKEAARAEEQWEEIQPFTTPVEMETGQEIVGVYLGAETINAPVKDDDDSEGIVEVDGRRVRPTLLHTFQQPDDDEPTGVWGSAVLDKLLADIPNGARVKLRYEGKQDLKGGRTVRRYRVWQDKSASF